MKYLIIAPDYTGSCIADEFNGKIDLSEFGLPPDFIAIIQVWHARYREIIPLNDEQRLLKMDLIGLLDQEGLEITSKLKDLISGGAKIKYFSEGRLKYLTD